MISRSTMLHIKARYAVEGLSDELIPYDRVLEAFLNRGLDGPVSVETHNPDRSVSNEEMSKRTVLAMQRAWPTAAQGGVVARRSGKGLKRPWHDDPVGFAVIGLGMGFNRARQLTETSGTRLIGVCDLDAERAQKAGGTFDVPHSLDMDRWLEDDDVEVIMVMSETGNHGKIAERALNAGLRHAARESGSGCELISRTTMDNSVSIATGRNRLPFQPVDATHWFKPFSWCLIV